MLGTDLDSNVDHDTLPVDSDHLVNKIPKIVDGGVSIVSTPVSAEDTYGIDEIIAFMVTFDSEVVVDTTNGTPTLVVSSGTPIIPPGIKRWTSFQVPAAGYCGSNMWCSWETETVTGSLHVRTNYA